jgi:hypothetical protein
MRDSELRKLVRDESSVVVEAVERIIARRNPGKHY